MRENYDAVVGVKVRKPWGEKQFSVSNAREQTTGLTGSVEQAVDVSEFVDVVIEYLNTELDIHPSDFNANESVGEFGIVDKRSGESDEASGFRFLDEVEIERL